VSNNGLGHIGVGVEIPSPRTEVEWDKRLRPIKRKVLCLKGYNDDWRDEEGNVLLYRATFGNTASKERTWLAEILAIGPECETLTENDIGSWIELPEWAPNDMLVLPDGYVVFDERLIRDPTENDSQTVKPYVIVE